MSSGFGKFKNVVTAFDVVHERIHQGIFFTSLASDVSLGNGATLDCLLITPAAPVVVHFRPQLVAGGDFTMDLFEDTVVSANGIATPIANQNRLRATDLLPLMQIFSGPTITDDGELLASELVPGGTGPAQSVGASASFYEEWVLKQGANYLLRATNISGAVQPINMTMSFYRDGVAAP